MAEFRGFGSHRKYRRPTEEEWRAAKERVANGESEDLSAVAHAVFDDLERFREQNGAPGEEASDGSRRQTEE